MEKGKFTKDFEVHYYEVNKYQEATPVAILNFLEETAVSHSETAGFGVSRLKADNVGWVLNRWNIKIDRYPLWNEKISVDTWPSNIERFYATREFHIRDKNSNIIGRASSLWIFLNVEKKRPIRIPPNFGEAYGLGTEKAIEDPFRELDTPGEWKWQKEFSVKRSDIDTNEHVNNTRYVEWMLETVPQEVYDSCSVSSLEVTYKKETSYGSAILSSCKTIADSSSENTYSHDIACTGSGQTLASAITTWTRHLPGLNDSAR